MASFGGRGPLLPSYAPSAPSMPESPGQDQQQQHNSQYHCQHPPPPRPYNGNQTYYGRPPSFYSYGQSYDPSSFPPGTRQDVIKCFEGADRDRSGLIDEKELQQALSSVYHQYFGIRTIRLLMFLFKNPRSDFLKIGPSEFAALWNCVAEWRTIFERYDKDRSGKIDGLELRDALYGMGYSIPASVLYVIISHYGDGSGHKAELNFDYFVECGMIIKGLTEKFKERDSNYTGNATFTYDAFMATVLPFLVSYD